MSLCVSCTSLFFHHQLLETVKRFMTLRVKSDKEYAALLLNMTQQTEKQEAADYISTVSKVRPHLRAPPGCLKHLFIRFWETGEELCGFCC